MKTLKPVGEAATIPELFHLRVQHTPEAVAYEYKKDGTWVAVTYAEYGRLVREAAAGFYALGVRRGDAVAIWGETTPEWTILDLGAMTAGAHVAGIYQTSTIEQATHILNNAQATWLCVDTPERLEKGLEIAPNTPTLRGILYWGEGDPAHDDVITYASLFDRGREVLAQQPDLYERMVAAVSPEDMAVLIYTSGTTGLPKGVMLTHENCMTNAKRLFESEIVEEGDSMIAFLPMSHVAEHTSQFLGRILGGLTAYFCPDYSKLGEVLTEKKPTILIGVPRVFEKIYHRVMTGVRAAPKAKQRLFFWALDIGHQVAKCKEFQRPIPTTLAVKHALADRLVLSKIREALGGRLRIIGCAAAPIDVKIIDFFMASGILFLEAYGLSECGGASHCNRPSAYRVGTVGKPVPGCECKIAEDGEILLRSPAVFRGYLGMPEETREVLDEDGWLHTGDIGEVDADGFLRITDRKKNLIITAGGKNVAPAPIETLIKRDPIVNQVVVLGDRKPYLVALVTVSHDYVQSQGLTQEEVRARVAHAVAEANKHLARFEQVKRFAVLEREFSVDSGEMTPTLKIKRNVVAKHYADIIESLYTSSEQALAG